MPAYRTGIIGCGNISRAHASGWKAQEKVELAAAADVSEEQLKRFAAEYPGVRLYAEYGEMLEKEELHFVSICTWQGLHCEITVAAAEHGVQGILCEKPMAMGLGEADRMLAVCEKGGAMLVIGHQHRFDPQAVEARRLITVGEIGEVVFIRGFCTSDLYNNGTHVVDLVRCLNDDRPVQWVMGQIDRRKNLVRFGQEVEDMAIGLLHFENGVRALIEQGEHAPPYYGFQIYGSAGFIHLNDPKGPRLRARLKGQGEDYVPDLPGGSSHTAEIAEFVRCYEEGREHRSSGRQGRATLEAMMAIYESSRRRGLVELHLAVAESPLLAMIAAAPI